MKQIIRTKHIGECPEKYLENRRFTPNKIYMIYSNVTRFNGILPAKRRISICIYTFEVSPSSEIHTFTTLYTYEYIEDRLVEHAESRTFFVYSNDIAYELSDDAISHQLSLNS